MKLYITNRITIRRKSCICSECGKNNDHFKEGFNIDLRFRNHHHHHRKKRKTSVRLMKKM